MDPTPLLLFLAVCIVLMLGFPVAFSLAGTALFFALVGTSMAPSSPASSQLYPAVFTASWAIKRWSQSHSSFLWVLCWRGPRLQKRLLESMSKLFGRLRGGLGLSVTLVGMLMAASTGIVGATVVTMGVLSLPTMLKRNYDPCLRHRHNLCDRYPRTNHPAIHRTRLARRRTLQRLPASTA